jgi:hypothetical protein
MHDAGLMAGVECACDPGKQRQGLGCREAASRGKVIGQGQAPQQLHGDEDQGSARAVAGLEQLVDPANIGMGHLAGAADLGS